MSWKEAWVQKDRPGTDPHTPTALAHLGNAAVCVNDWLRVQQNVRAFNDLRPETALARLRRKCGRRRW